MKKQNRRSELAKLGYVPIAFNKHGNPTSYVNTRSSEILSRRQAEKKVVGSFEKFAQANKERRGGFNPMSRYTTRLKSYAESRGISKGEARSDPDFRATYKASIDDRKTPAATMRRLEALYDLDVLDETLYNEYIAHYIGEDQ